MKNINDLLYSLYKDGKYNEYINLLSNYLGKGYSLDFEMIIHYLFVLTKLRKFDEAYNIAINLKKYLKYDNKHNLAKILYYCYKLDEAQELLQQYDIHLLKDDYLLARIYMLKGDLDSPRIIFERILKDPKLNDVTRNTIKKHLQKIYNKEKYNAFVEIEYNAFLEKGNSLAPGYIVYIQNSPIFTNSSEENSDIKASNRPYMIWKIENEMVYMFPVTRVCGKNPYHLYFQNYPNSEYDRTIKDNLCITTLDNIITVADKVLNNDYKIIMNNIFISSYNCPILEEKEGKRKFLEEYVGTPKVNDVISYYEKDGDEGKSHFYLVLNILDEDYEVIELDYTLTNYIGEKKTIPKNRFIFSIKGSPENTLARKL